MTRIIRRKLGDPLSEESIQELKRLAEMPDELINTDDIPERPIGSGKRVILGAKLQEAALQRKAS
jgi:hypothetical protein